ncbi:MAG: ribonuclease HI family protein [Syntrophaceae bacterium]
MSSGPFQLFTDGASRGNPGQAGAGVVLRGPDGGIVCCGKKFLGVCTNNEAEYRALNMGLETALKQKYRALEIYLDSELVVRQLEGIYKIKNARLSELSKESKRLLSFLDSYSIRHIPREKNAAADKLANEAIDDHLSSAPA